VAIGYINSKSTYKYYTYKLNELEINNKEKTTNRQWTAKQTGKGKRSNKNGAGQITQIIKRFIQWQLKLMKFKGLQRAVYK
jgi:hypothetical protein